MKKLAPLLVVALSACATVPPAPAVVRSPMGIAAPMSRTWDAVIDVFASKNIPIANMDRSSGFISTAEMSVPITPGQTWADCGTFIGRPQLPSHANYNIRVKETGPTTSTVLVATFWKISSSAAGQTAQCTSTGKWETEAETEIKQRAEK